MYWCLPEPESDIAVTIIFVTAIMTDKPLVIVWLMSRIYKKCCKRNVVKQVRANFMRFYTPVAAWRDFIFWSPSPDDEDIVDAMQRCRAARKINIHAV